jgi:hypothetical protein
MKPAILISIILCLAGCDRQSDVERGIDKPTHWMYITSMPFADGGSVALGFLDENGRIIYLWVDSPFNSKNGTRFYLKRTFNDKERIEILKNSELEKRIIALIDGCIKYEFLSPYIADIQLVRKMILDRSIPFNNSSDLYKKWEPNQSLQTTTTAVTDRAVARSAPAAVVSDL